MTRLAGYRNVDPELVPPTMKALVLSGPGFENLAVREVRVPEVGDGQLLCRVDAAGVCTSNIKIIAQGSDHISLNGWDLRAFPIILGDEGSLTLVKVGKALGDRYTVGQRFAIQPAVDVAPILHRERYRDGARGMHKCSVGYTLGGNLAEYLLIQEEVLAGQCLIPLPEEGLPYYSVAMGEPISCIYSAQQRHVHLRKDGPYAERVAELGLLRGGTTLIVGAGVMGRIHCELALRFRPRNLLISDIDPARLRRVEQSLGAKAADLGVRLQTVPARNLEETLRRVSGGEGADDIILAVGIREVQQEALSLLARGGVANLFGGLPRGKHILNLDALDVHYRETRVVGSSGGEPSDLRATLEAIAGGEIEPGNYVYGIGSLQHAPEILQGILQNRVDGKAILYPHAEIKTFQTVESWSRSREEEHLERCLGA
jgi:threonine dehydrogenase-like Zn-dependent dehydrogenase